MSFELIILQLSRLFILTTVSFVLALLLTPVLLKILSKYNVGKQIRAEGAPVLLVFIRKKKERQLWVVF